MTRGRSAVTLSDRLLNAWKSVGFDLFSIRHTLATYNRAKFRADIMAALTVALVAFPQGIAYALIAGLPPEYGIYCSAVAPMVAALFSRSRFNMVGPTNATAILMLAAVQQLPPGLPREQSVALFVLMVGVLIIAGSLVHVAGLTRYVSRSVLAGYVTVAAVLIIANQLHHLFGSPLPGTTTLISVLAQTVRFLGQSHWESVVVTAVTAGLLWLFLAKFPKWPAVALTLVLVGIGNAIGQHFGFVVPNVESFPLGHVPVTTPRIDFETIAKLSNAALAVAFVAVLENTFMAKSLGHKAGDPIDANQEMFALGLANAASAFTSGMVASGSLTRSALNWASGAVTQMSGFWCGLLCLVGALALGPLIGFIPKAALAVVVIYVATKLIDLRQLAVCFQATPSDRVVLIATAAAAVLMPLNVAIFFGVAVSIALFLQEVGSPELSEYAFNEEGNLAELQENASRKNPHISIIHVEGDLFFGSSELFRDHIRRVCADPQLRVVILRLKNARHLDATTVLAIEELNKYLKETGRHLLISGVNKEALRVLRNAGMIDRLERNVFPGSPQNPNVATRNALRRAQELLGTKDAPVRLFFDEPKSTVGLPATAPRPKTT